MVIIWQIHLLQPQYDIVKYYAWITQDQGCKVKGEDKLSARRKLLVKKSFESLLGVSAELQEANVRAEFWRFRS